MTKGMQPVKALKVLLELCQDDWIVVTNQSSARIWPKLVRRPLDLHYNPSTMGGAVPLALGLALAQPDREVVCITGDGALLMNLGSLVTVAACQPTNLTIIVLDNGLYEVTGGQKTPGCSAQVDFYGLAEAAGIDGLGKYDNLADWQEDIADIFESREGTRLISLHVEPTPLEYLKFPTPPIAEQLATFRAALSGSSK